MKEKIFKVEQGYATILAGGNPTNQDLITFTKTLQEESEKDLEEEGEEETEECELCGGTGEVDQCESVWVGEPHQAFTGKRPCICRIDDSDRSGGE